MTRAKRQLTLCSLTYFFKNGKVKAEGTFENELMIGEWKFYRETGQLWQVGNFENGKKNGIWIRYDKNNQLEYKKNLQIIKFCPIKSISVVLKYTVSTSKKSSI
ncbi:hypothetical protein JCM17380_41310 [Desulfosporosinus burensis]